MYYNKIEINLSPGYAFNLAKFEQEDNLETMYELHYHDFLEICYIEFGKGNFLIDDREYKINSGDIIIVNNLEKHTTIFEASCKVCVVQFDPCFVYQNNMFDFEYLQPFFNRSIDFSNCIASFDHYSEKIVELVKEIELEWTQMQEGYKLVVKGLLIKLLAILYRHYKSEGKICESRKTFRESFERIKETVDFIHQNFTNDITLHDISQSALMHRTYFSGYFKNVMKITISDYLRNLRINMACNLLRTTSKQ